MAAEIAAHVDTCTPCMRFVGGVIDEVLEFPNKEPPSDEALDEEGEACWLDFLARHGATLGIDGDRTLPSEGACADLVREVAQAGAKNWLSFLSRYKDELWSIEEEE